MDGSGPQANNALEIIEFADHGDNLGFFKISSYSTVTLKLAHEEEQYYLSVYSF